jgi:ABC-2 type transport system ATP-binding protein
MDVLTLSHVSKSFGSHQIITDLSFSVPEHTIYGFIGQNGAGKTTTMKMVLGLYTMDAGEIKVLGEKVTYGENKTNRYIGYLPDVPEFYGYMTPKEYLNLCGDITGMKANEKKKQIHDLLELVGLEKSDKRIHGFSRGMKQRLGIAQALLNQPRILICDEPTSALDPVGRKEILDILLSVKDKTTVVFSTHILSDVERICDEIGLLNNGQLAMEKTMQEIHQMHHSNGFMVEFQNPQDVLHFQNVYAGGEMISPVTLLFKHQGKSEMGKAMTHLVEENIIPLRLEMCEPTLENLFMEVVGK